MDFAENIISNPVVIKLRREEESLGRFSLFGVIQKKYDSRRPCIIFLYIQLLNLKVMFCYYLLTFLTIKYKLADTKYNLSLFWNLLFMNNP